MSTLTLEEKLRFLKEMPWTHSALENARQMSLEAIEMQNLAKQMKIQALQARETAFQIQAEAKLLREVIRIMVQS